MQYDYHHEVSVYSQQYCIISFEVATRLDLKSSYHKTSESLLRAMTSLCRAGGEGHGTWDPNNKITPLTAEPSQSYGKPWMCSLGGREPQIKNF